MPKTEILSVRVTRETRELLAAQAIDREVAGVSALAREILEGWARKRLAAQRQAGVRRAVSYLREHPAGWDDDPDAFFTLPGER